MTELVGLRIKAPGMTRTRVVNCIKDGKTIQILDAETLQTTENPSRDQFPVDDRKGIIDQMVADLDHLLPAYWEVKTFASWHLIATFKETAGLTTAGLLEFFMHPGIPILNCPLNAARLRSMMFTSMEPFNQLRPFFLAVALATIALDSATFEKLDEQEQRMFLDLEEEVHTGGLSPFITLPFYKELEGHRQALADYAQWAKR